MLIPLTFPVGKVLPTEPRATDHHDADGYIMQSKGQETQALKGSSSTLITLPKKPSSFC